ncbi:MAG: hypothetical protein AAFV93_17250 [Chloroflexota bacterium]
MAKLQPPLSRQQKRSGLLETLMTAHLWLIEITSTLVGRVNFKTGWILRTDYFDSATLCPRSYDGYYLNKPESANDLSDKNS